MQTTKYLPFEEEGERDQEEGGDGLPIHDDDHTIHASTECLLEEYVHNS